MAEIGSIYLKVDTSNLERGTSELDKFKGAAAGAAKSADDFGDSGKGVSKVSAEVAKNVEETHRRVAEYAESLRNGDRAQKENAQSLKVQQQELQALLARINPTTKAFDELDKITSKLADANKKKLLPDEQFRDYSAILEETRNKLQRTADAMTAEGRAALEEEAATKRSTAAKESFLSRLKEQNALYKTSASDAAAYRAEQLGISKEAAPLIASLREQENATRRDAEQKRLAAMSARTLKEQIKLLEVEERAATQATKAQEAADKSATNAKEAFLRKLKEQVVTQNMSRQELLQYRASQLGVSSAADIYIKKINAAEGAVHSFSLQSSAARREIGVMIGELARGNIGALRGSSITLANRSGLIDQLMTFRGAAIAGGIGLVAAGIYGLAKAAYEGSQESVEFNKQLILTGSYAGRTASQLQEMAKSISGRGITEHDASGVLAQVVGSGAFKSSRLEDVTKAAAAMQHATGQSVDETIKNFKKLYNDPIKASQELNNELHYLTSAQYEYISSLETRGFKEAAGDVAAKAYSDAMERRSRQVIENFGTIEKVTRSVTEKAKEMWDALLGIGRTESVADKLKRMESDLAEAQGNDKQGLWGRFKNNATGIDRKQLEENIKQLRGVVLLNNDLAAATSKAREADDLAIQSLEYKNRILGKRKSYAQLRSADLTELWWRVSQKPGLWSAEERERAVAQINFDRRPPRERKGPSERAPAAYRDDAGTKELLASQQRVAALKDQMAASVNLTEQENQLSKFTQKIADLKDKKILTADQQSLLARSSEISASLQLEAQLSRENVQRKKAVDALKQMSDYSASIASKNAQEQAKFGLTSRQAGRVDQETQLDNTFRKQTQGIDDPAALAKITAEYNHAKATLQDGWRQEDKNRGDWAAGLKSGVAEFGETASDVFTATSQLANSTLSNMSSMMTELVTTGSASVKQFTKTFLTSIVEIINKLLLAQAIQSAMGWIGAGASAGSAAAGAGSAASGASTGAMGMSTSFRAYDVGGYTGDGGKYEPKGFVHGGEFVFTKEATAVIGKDNLYGIMRDAQGFADGGYVGTGRAPMLGMRGGNTALSVDVGDINIINQGGGQQGQASNQAMAGVQNQLKTAIKQTITEQLNTQGTPLWKAVNAKAY